MKIRTNLLLLSAIFVMLIAAFGFMVLQSFSHITRETKASNGANKLIKGIAGLNIVTYEYAMHHDKRMQQQWVLKYGSLGKLLDTMPKESHPECISTFQTIISDYKVLGNLFSELRANLAKRKRLIEENRPQNQIRMSIASQERLIAQTMMRSQKITSEAFKYSIIIQQCIGRVQQRTKLIILFSIIGFIILPPCIALLMTITITRPLNKLIKSAQIVGRGDLQHRVDIKTKNEVGELAGAFNQMTERRQLADEALEKSKTAYQDLFSSAPVAYFSVRTDGSIKTANTAAEDFTGHRLEELQRMKVANLYAEESKEKAKRLFDRFSRGNLLENEEMLYERKDGQKIHGLLSVTAIRDENGLVLESRSVVVDITERKRAEEDLKQHRNDLEEMVGERTSELDKRILEVEQLNSAMVNILEDLRASNETLEITARQLKDANKELESFSYSVSHDLRAPLRAIDGFSRMVVEDYWDKLDADGKHQLKVIQDSAQEMGQLIDNLLAFSRLGRKAMTMSDIDMVQLAEEVFEKLTISDTEQTARLNIHKLPHAYGDISLIREVFMNLLSNAIKFTKPGETAVIELSGETKGEKIIYSVKDRGVGFDMKYSDKLFRVFQRLHSTEEFEGTGIGLALIQRIIHRHNGRAWAEAKENEGATFYFTLPIV